MDNTIGVVGLWHLGCVLSASWYKIGNKVIGFDYDKQRVDTLSKGNMPIYEPGLENIIKIGLKKNDITFTKNIELLSKCEYVFLSYDTPVLDDDSSDTTILENTINEISTVLKDETILIISSQSPVGFCRIMRKNMQKINKTLELAYSPENLQLGDAVYCYLNPQRIILGTDNFETEEKCKKLFEKINASVITMDFESAEMVKHGINAFLATSIVFTNNLTDLCEITNAKIDDVVIGMKTDRRIGPYAYLSPGIGFSGGTLGRDLKVLDKTNTDSNGQAELFGIIHNLNSLRKYSIVERIYSIMKGKTDIVCGVLGITYKPGTSTLRRSLPIEIVSLLIKHGATIKVYDPCADYSEMKMPIEFEVSSNINEAANGADILILLTEWTEFKDYNWNSVISLMNKPIFFDVKNYLSENQMASIGFSYYSIGR